MKNRKTKKKTSPRKIQCQQVSQVWVNPNSTFKDPRANPAWGRRQLSPPTAARLLELADIALGIVQPPSKKKNKAVA